MRRLALAIIALSYTPLIAAQQTLYDGEHGLLSTGLHIQTAMLIEGNNRLGEPNKSQFSDVFSEITLEPNIKAIIKLPHESQLYAGFSVIYGGQLGYDPSGNARRGVEMSLEKADFTQVGRYRDYRGAVLTEEKYIGWRSGKLFPSWGENAIDLSAVAQDYKLGTGLLLANGTDDGGYRGSYWIGARSAFINTLMAKINIQGIKLEAFHLQTRPRDLAAKKNYDGINLEYNYNDIANIGFSYINENNKGHKRNLHEDGSTVSLGYGSINNNIYNARLSFSPLPDTLPDLSISGEYVYQENNRAIQPNFDFAVSERQIAQGGYTEISHKFSDDFWKPTLSYRYTRLGKNFISMAYGFTTWSTWWQGEINGEWILDNSNLITHVGRLVLTPAEKVTVNLIYLNYEFVNPKAFDLTSASYGNEVNLLTDWAVTDTIDLSAGIETFVPGEAGKQYLNGNKTWVQGMLYASFKF